MESLESELDILEKKQIYLNQVLHILSVFFH